MQDLATKGNRRCCVSRTFPALNPQTNAIDLIWLAEYLPLNLFNCKQYCIRPRRTIQKCSGSSPAGCCFAKKQHRYLQKSTRSIVEKQKAKSCKYDWRPIRNKGDLTRGTILWPIRREKTFVCKNFPSSSQWP